MRQRKVQMGQISAALRTAIEELTYSAYIVDYPKSMHKKGYDSVCAKDKFYKTICNTCFNDSLLMTTSLIDKDTRGISFWNWTDFISAKSTALQLIYDLHLYKRSPLKVKRDQLAAHLDAGNFFNRFPDARRNRISQPALIKPLQELQNDLVGIFITFTEKVGGPLGANYFDDLFAKQEIALIMCRSTTHPDQRDNFSPSGQPMIFF